MGREIRRVPANWEHPKYTADTSIRRDQIGHYIPLKDDHEQALKEFAADIDKNGLKKAIDYWGGGPCSDDYVHYGDARTWWQVYETVSEGTPVSPPFANPEELIEYLVKHGDFWDQQRGESGWSRPSAEAFVKSGWAPSAVMVGGMLYANADALTIPKT